jgi:LPXTG-site transpeptidase (sortase) family protein
VQAMARRLRRVSRRIVGPSLLLAGLMLLALAVSLLSRFSGTAGSAGSAQSTPTRTIGAVPSTPTASARPTMTPIRPAATRTVAVPTPTKMATRLVIPSLNIDAPVVEVPLVDGRWDVSIIEHEIGHLEGTARVGQKGNMVLAGHVTLRSGGGPFLHLYKLQPGDIAVVYAGSERFEYRVMDKKQVSPEDLSVVQPSLEPTLSLLTCSEWDAESRTYRQRFVVTASLASETISRAPRNEGGLRSLTE